MTPAFLDLERALNIHRVLIERFGGSGGIRDLGLLESALAMPRQAFGGQYLHSDLFEMAAAYLFHIVKNHPFVDGNKRVGAMAAYCFLEVNGIELDASNEEFERVTLTVAEGKLSKSGVAEFFREHGKRGGVQPLLRPRVKPAARTSRRG
jgi:death-on-curing protein